MNFICNKKGCKVTKELPKEVESLVADWDKKIEERTRERKNRGCWNPAALECDCPACGGFND